MSELQLIQSTVGRAGRRRRWQRAWRGFWQGLLVAGGIWLVTLALYKALPLPLLCLPVGGVVGVLSLLIGFAAGWFRRETPRDTARWLDLREHLQERVSTALEFGTDPKAGAWGELVVKDAAAHLAGVDLKRLLPYRLPNACRWTVLVLALCAGLGFVPEYRSQAFLQKQREKETIKDAGRHLADLSRRTLEKRTPALDTTRQAVQSVGELGQQLARNPVTRNEALRELARMTEKVQQETRELSRNPALRAMDRAARNSDRNSPASADELQRQLESLQKSLGSRPANEDALDKLKQALERARQAAAAMQGKDSAANDASRESLAKALSSLARQSQELGASLPSLEEAIAALNANQFEQVLKNLEVAEKDLDKLRDMAQSLQQLQQQAEKMGRDLAEQLKNGQAEAAVSTLRKMINQLKSGNPSGEQMKAMMDEIGKAIEPAAPYGKVPEHLKQALRQMQGGQRAQAGESLADAAKELESLMQQLADAQDLKSSLEALKKAQVCIGNGKGWSQCQGPPSYKPGGKPGRGVGTWADEDGWIDTPPDTGAWDNSGVERPDMDSRGLTDRGDGELSDRLAPTKVKGQFQPGGQMPSITLKGVSIKGQSTVEVQAAIQAAQSDAESALSHEQVPRAYQGAVKDYFDDLKK